MEGHSGLTWPVEHAGKSRQSIANRRVDAGEGFPKLTREARRIGRVDVGETRQAGYQDPRFFPWAARVGGQ